VPYDFQLGVDAERPHELADWWAETLGWTVEVPDEGFIRRMIDEGYATEDETMTWKGRLVWITGAAIRHPDGRAGGPGRRIFFQQVPEPKSVKNRWHVDVWVGADNVPSAVETLAGRGATYLHDGQQGPHRWVTMADPEGNEFCLS
jgi:Glyoxalase-like domain